MEAIFDIVWLLFATTFVAAENKPIYELNIISHRNSPYSESGESDNGIISSGYNELVIPYLQRFCGYRNVLFTTKTRENIYQILQNGSLLLAESDSSNQNGSIRRVNVIGPLPPIQLTSGYSDFVEYVQFCGSPGIAVVMNLEEITLIKRMAQAVSDSELVLFLMVLMAIVSGVAIWLVERWNKRTDFNPCPSYGIFDGFWWSVVTLTTTGYGDKIPRTFFGRVLACLWMVCGVVLCCNLTSILTESMSDIQLDIKNERVAVLQNSMELLLTNISLKAKHVVEKKSYEECLDSVHRGDTYVALLDYNAAATLQSYLDLHRMAAMKVLDLPFPLNIYVLKSEGTDKFVNERLFPCFDKYLPHFSKAVMQSLAPLLTVKRVHRPRIAEFLQTTQEPWVYVALGVMAVAVLFLAFGCLLRLWKFYRTKAVSVTGEDGKSVDIVIGDLSTKLDLKLKQFKEELINDIQAIRYEKSNLIY